MKKDSGLWKLQLQDFVKGLIVAMIGAIVAIVQVSIEAGSLEFDFKAMGKVALLTGVSYLIKNFLTNNKGDFAAPDKPTP
jgi:hypothetical protein